MSSNQLNIPKNKFIEYRLSHDIPKECLSEMQDIVDLIVNILARMIGTDEVNSMEICFTYEGLYFQIEVWYQNKMHTAILLQVSKETFEECQEANKNLAIQMAQKGLELAQNWPYN